MGDIMSIEDRFNVYITGEVLEGYDLVCAQQSFAEKFKLSVEKTQKVFQSSMPFLIKKSVDSKIANAYKNELHLVGLVSTVELIEPPAIKPVKAELSLVEESAGYLDAAPQIAASKSYGAVVERKEFSGQPLAMAYEAPSSELVDEGSSSVGGWLRFFQVINVISIVMIGIVMMIVVGVGFLEGFESQEVVDIFFSLPELIPSVIFSVLILRVLGVQGEETPFRISAYLKYNVSITVVVFIVLMALFFSDVISERPESLLGSLIYYYIWTSYFKKSVRVKEFYGRNAT